MGVQEALAAQYTLDGSTHYGYDNDNLDSGEGVPPGDWTNIGTIGDNCVPSNADSDELSTVSASAYTDMSSDNDTPYVSRGSWSDYSCIGTNWVIAEDPGYISQIDIVTNSWIQTANDHVRFYVKNWSTGNYDHLGQLTVTSSSSPGMDDTTSITSGFSDYIDGSGNFRLVFIVEEANIDWDVDLLQLDVVPAVAPSTPTLAETPAFANMLTNDTTPELGNFSTTDPQSDDVEYEIQWDEDYNFGSPVTRTSSDYPTDGGWTAATFASGASASYIVQSGDALTNGQTYWWRVRARDPSGSNTWSAYSVKRSFTIDTSISLTGWFQTTDDQFATGTSTQTETTGSGGVKIEGW